jgi:hypothetical protein
MSAGLTIHEVNNYVVAGMGANPYYGYTPANGSIRQVAGLTSSGGSNYVEMDLFDNTASTFHRLLFVGLCQRALGGRGAGTSYSVGRADDSHDQWRECERVDSDVGDDQLDDGSGVEFAGGIRDDGELWVALDAKRDGGDDAYGEPERADGGEDI